MILMDTNIISEMMKTSPAQHALDWLDQQVSSELYVSTITVAEISYGLHVLAKGKRRRLLEQTFESTIAEAFKGRLLSFDEPAAKIYGRIMGQRKELGRPMSVPDGQIAAIALHHKMALATRNIKDFQDCGLRLINPFK